MRKEYIFVLIFAILCFLGGNYYSTYNGTYNSKTLFVNKGIATEKETKDPFKVQISTIRQTLKIQETGLKRVLYPMPEQHVK